MKSDLDRARRENIRWIILLALNAARPLGANEQLILGAITSLAPDATPLELRKELDYLAERDLIEISGRQAAVWFAKLTRFGIDVIEYTVDCEPGIARPSKYW